MPAFVLALVVAAVVTPGVRSLLIRQDLLDHPNHRSSHTVPTPRGGGIAVALAAAIATLTFGASAETFVLVSAAATLGAVGFVDDRRSLGATTRLIAQVVVPTAAIAWLVAREPSVGALVAGCVGVVWCVGYVNAFNFMDGINGISGTQAAVAGVMLAALSADVPEDAMKVAGWAVAGAAVGFLPFNVRGRIFLGDVGSYFLGAWLSLLAILVISEGASAVVVAAPFLLYLADTSVVLIRRAMRGDPLTEAHREHAYQRLVQAGWSHVAVAALCAAISTVCSVAMFLVRDASSVAQVGTLIGCLVLVVGYLLLPAAVGRGDEPS